MTKLVGTLICKCWNVVVLGLNGGIRCISASPPSDSRS
jgi:hypothetical protein